MSSKTLSVCKLSAEQKIKKILLALDKVSENS